VSLTTLELYWRENPAHGASLGIIVQSLHPKIGRCDVLGPGEFAADAFLRFASGVGSDSIRELWRNVVGACSEISTLYSKRGLEHLAFAINRDFSGALLWL